MGWLITWLLLALLGALAVVTRRGRRHPPTDETLIAELLGPSQPPTVRVLPPPAPQPQKDDEPRPAPQPLEDEPPPAPTALPAGEGGWLETQLALITAWSERMQKQIASSQADPDPWRCIAITTKGSQCKLIAEPGDTKCAIHGGHPDRLPVAQCAGHCRDASHSHPRQPSLALDRPDRPHLLGPRAASPRSVTCWRTDKLGVRLAEPLGTVLGSIHRPAAPCDT